MELTMVGNSLLHQMGKPSEMHPKIQSPSKKIEMNNTDTIKESKFPKYVEFQEPLKCEDKSSDKKIIHVSNCL